MAKKKSTCVYRSKKHRKVSAEQKTSLGAKRCLYATTTVAIPCNHQIAISPITDESTTSQKSKSGTSSTSTAGFTTNKSLSSTSTSTKKTWQEQLVRRQAIAELFLNHLNCPQRSLWHGSGGNVSQIKAIYLDTHRETITSILNKAEIHISRGDFF